MAIIQWLRDYSIVWMAVVFVLLMAYTFWPARRAALKHDAEIPLHDDR